MNYRSPGFSKKEQKESLKKVKGLKNFGGDKNVDVHRAQFSICGGAVKG
jgi:hypothetical protein